MQIGIFSYEAPSISPAVVLTQPRVISSQLKINLKRMMELKGNAHEKLEQMTGYCFTKTCRFKYILDYFGEIESNYKCGKCDNCLSGGEGMVLESEVKNNHSEPERFKKYGFKKKKEEADFGEIKVEKKTLSTKLTQLETLDLYNKGKSIAEIAVERGFAENTVYGHLEFLIEKGLIKDINKLVDSKKQDKIFAAIKKAGADKLTPIKDELSDDYSWEEIKLARAKFIYRATHSA